MNDLSPVEPAVFSRPIIGALTMFEKGYKVFPLKSNDKKPAVIGWQEWAKSCTKKRIEDYGRANPTANWGVSCEHSGLFVLDIDRKKADGTETLRALILKNNGDEIMHTLTVLTPTGGSHKYFSGSGKSTAGALGPGLDTRSIGGYVVAPGSRIDEKTYEYIDGPVPPVPEWILNAIPTTPPVVLEDNVPIDEGERNKVLTSIAGTMRARGMNHESILAALMAMNETQLSSPLPQHEIEVIARSVARYEPSQAKAASDFLEPVQVQAEFVDEISFASIKARDWIMQDRYIGGFISVVISPGGVGKSTYSMLDAIAIASGKPLTGFEVRRPGAAWVYNTEDPRDELARRFHAAAIHHGVRYADLDHRIHFTSGRDKPFILVKAGQEGVVINKDAIDRTCEYIKKHQIRLFLADPFVRTHEVNENDNMQIDKVMWCFSRIADKTGCAIGIIHHTSKQGSNPDNAVQGNMNAARGATALVYAARIAHTINGMTEEEALKFGIAEDRRRWYFRLDNAKANMQPPAQYANWYERVNITLPNTDQVGTVEQCKLTDIRAEKKREAKNADRADLAKNLAAIMKPKEMISVHDAYLRLMSDPSASFIFENIKNDRAAERVLVELLSVPCVAGSKTFKLFLNPTGRPKFMVECSEIDLDLDIFK